MGEYTVLRRVAIGGMAEIFLARKDGMSGFERLVVLKRILPEYAHNQEFVRMFLNEARIAATLHHSNVVQVYAIGEEQGQVFFAMEFLHGEDLSRVLSRAGQLGKPMELDATLSIVSAVCAGLHYAHERNGPDGKPLGIVHRDVSPHNVFVTYEGDIKLLDFGIAKASTSIGKTRTGVLKGKVAYMSPEQAYSQPVDRRSDIFCIGILLWELSTGRRLYRRRSELETLKALVDADAQRPSAVVSSYPLDLEAIVMKCLARDPNERWATCDELSLALEQFRQSTSLPSSATITTRMMRTLFKAEIASYEWAIRSGKNIVDEVVERMEAAARKSSIDDWDSNVASIIVNIGSDAERKSPIIDGPLAAVAAPAVPIEPVDEPTNITPPPRFVELPVERPVVQRASVDATVRVTILGQDHTGPVEPVRRRWGIIAGTAAAAIALVVVIVIASGGGKPEPDTAPVATEKIPPTTAPQPAAAEPTPTEPSTSIETKHEEPAKTPPSKPIQTKREEPAKIVKPKIEKTVKAPEPKRIAEPKIVKAAPRPKIVKADPKPKIVDPPKPKPEPKKLEPVKKPEPKKPPTPTDLDSLPL